MDVRMPRVDGFESTRRIKEELGTTKVLLMSAYHNLEYVSEAIKAGAEGYVPKLAPLPVLCCNRKEGLVPPQRTFFIAEFKRIYGNRARLFRPFLARISLLNKVPL
jgi:CheY-like chemotaxis protein